ncbi:hypothetical protein C8J57DRAFT_1184808 [Mycena rebaudengoi]|nr:hypothetical protein C8J57DRAFT_1184808 [Mycena rebaudengoi]
MCAHSAAHYIFILRTALPPRAKRAPNQDFAPLWAARCFADALQVAVASRALDCCVYYPAPKFSDGTVVVCHPGTTHSGLRYASLAWREHDQGRVWVVALDARRHGSLFGRARRRSDDLSINVLAEEFMCVLQAVFVDSAAAPSLLTGYESSACVPQVLELKYRMSGAAVLDIIEGAFDAFSYTNRPNTPLQAPRSKPGGHVQPPQCALRRARLARGRDRVTVRRAPFLPFPV